MSDLTTSTIKEIVTRDFRTAAVFEKYSLDFCCGGAKTIEQACNEKSMDPSPIFADLEATSLRTMPRQDGFTQMELDELIDHIVHTHHEYVRRALPSLLPHTRKIASVHGERHPEVIEIADLRQGSRKSLKGASEDAAAAISIRTKPDTHDGSGTSIRRGRNVRDSVPLLGIRNS